MHCSDQRGDSLTFSSLDFEVVRACTIDSSQGGVVTIIASSSLGLQTNTVADEYEAQFRLDVDSTSGNGATDRWVNTYADAGDGSGKSVALSATQTVTPGPHTYYMLVRRNAGTGTVLLHDTSLSVVLVPAAVAASTTCGVSANSTFATVSAAFVSVASCALTVPDGGAAFLLGTASVGLSSNQPNSEFEAQFGLSIDAESADLDTTDRWVNSYVDSGDGVDETVAVSVLQPVTAGPHLFYLLARRDAGTGTVTIYDAALSVIVVPADSACGGSADQSFTTTSSVPEVMQQCAAISAGYGDALIVATSSVAISANTSSAATEWQFDLAVDGSELGYTDRWVDVYPDAVGDGNDRNMIDNAIVPVTSGSHAFTLTGRRYAGTEVAIAYDPSIAVILLAPDILFADGFELAAR
jgi:hypothetical protein